MYFHTGKNVLQCALICLKGQAMLKRTGVHTVDKKFYFAPMEGITGYVYRSVHHRFFPGVDKYFTPFLSPGPKKLMTPREKNDILPEHNEGIFLVPQILTNQADCFIKCGKELEQYGYKEVNLNLGCPSGTVAAKKKGSGFLEFPEELDRFLDQIFSGLSMEISIKTRIGKEDKEEFDTLLRIYNQYPAKELIIHPRLQTDYYKNTPDLETFGKAFAHSRNPVCYNGDLFTENLWIKFCEKFPDVDTFMLGRGLIRNPALADRIRERKGLEKSRLKEFHDVLCQEYAGVLSGDRNVLFKMKELWFYMGSLFPENQKYMKKIKKAQKLSDYQDAVNSLFRDRDLLEE